MLIGAGRSEPAPVFLVGPARSGTTLVYKALCLHRDVAWLSNYVRRAAALPHAAALNRICGLAPQTRRTVWFSGGDNAYVYGARRPLAHRVFPMPVEGEPVYTRCGIAARPGGIADGVAPDLVRLRRVFDTVRRTSGGRVLVNKRIANNLRIPLLCSAFPDARFVFLVRDGRAVAYSLSRVDWWADSMVWWYGDTPARWARDGGDPWELCARNWLEDHGAAEAGLVAVPRQQRFDVRYEDFVTAPIETLRAVADFAGLRADPAWEGELRALRFPDRNHTWRQRLDPAVIDRITAVQRPLLDRLGYPA